MGLVATMTVSLMVPDGKQQDRKDEIYYGHKGRLVADNPLQASLHHYKIHQYHQAVVVHPDCSIRVFDRIRCEQCSLVFISHAIWKEIAL